MMRNSIMLRHIQKIKVEILPDGWDAVSYIDNLGERVSIYWLNTKSYNEDEEYDRIKTVKDNLNDILSS